MPNDVFVEAPEAIEIIRQGGNILHAEHIILALSPRPIFHFQGRVVKVFLFHQASEILGGELEYLDSLLHLKGHSQVL